MLSCDNLTLARVLTRKLVSSFTRPFNILGKAGPVAYKLELPPEMKVHPNFQVSLLHEFQDRDRIFFGRQIHPPVPTLNVVSEVDAF